MKYFTTKEKHEIFIDKINMIKCEQDGYSVIMNSCHIFIDNDDHKDLLEFIRLNEK